MPSSPDSSAFMEAPSRKLAAILSADVAGYSALMGRNEAATVQALSELRAVVRASVEGYGGKINDAKGDAILAEFASAVNAVSCAVDIQRRLSEHNASLPEERRMRLRVGVNLGDVIVRDDTVYGDGVNIAARLQALAEPGGIRISRMVYESIKNKLPLTCESLGRKAMKNIADPVEVFRVSTGDGGTDETRRRRWRTAAVTIAVGLLTSAVVGVWLAMRAPSAPEQSATGMALALPAEPSIAVLPFANLSGNPEDDWFTDGMTETLITDLSRLDRLFVIARNSTFTYKGKAVDVRRVGQELGVRYVLEGSLQRTSERLRVNAQLVEAQTGRHLWAERYDRNVADVFEIQDDIAQHIVTELDVKLLEGEQARAWRKTTRNRRAYDLFLKAQAHLNRFTREDLSRAQELFQQALAIDPNFTIAIAMLGGTHQIQADSGWSPDPGESYRKVVALCRRAVAIDPSFGDAYAGMANALLGLGKHSEAMAAAEKALALSPNHADTLALSGWVFALNGRAEQAVSLAERALRRNPFPPDWYFGGLGDSLLFANRVEHALAAHRKCVDRLPDFIWCQLGLTVDYVEVGKLEQATAQARELIRINPEITAQDNTYVRSIGVAGDRRRVIEALHKAGLN